MSAQPRIAIAGVGAVGTLIAYRLVAAGCPVTLVARGRRAAQLHDGLIVDDGPPLIAPIVEARDLQPHAIVIVATKEGSLAAMMEGIGHALQPDTLIIPLVNGIPFWFDSVARAAVPGRIVGAVTYVMARLDERGRGESAGIEKLVLGALDGKDSAGLDTIARMLSSSGIATRISGDIKAEVWSKVALNLATNPLSVLTGATLQTQFHDAELTSLVRGVLAEAIGLARATGVEPSMTLDEMMALGRCAGPAQTSMLQDHLAGRPLELGAIADSCLALALRAAVAMPLTDTIVKLVKFNDHKTRRVGDSI